MKKTTAKESRVVKKIKHTHQKTKQAYRSVMPDKKRHRIMVWVAFFCIVTVLACQMLYPLDRALPFARLGDKWVGFSKEADVASQVESIFQSKEVILKLGQDEYRYKLSKTGAEHRYSSSVKKLFDYPFAWRLVPLSILWQAPNSRQLDVEFSYSVLQQFSRQVSDNLSQKSINASLKIQEGKLIATDDKPGRLVRAGDVTRAIRNHKYSLNENDTILLEAEIIKPAKTGEQFSAVKSQAEKALARSVVISNGSKSMRIKPEEIAKWLELAEDDKKNTVLRINQKALGEDINKWSDMLGRAAGRTNINLQNGQEIGRVEGVKGSKIDADKLIPRLASYILNGSGPSSGLFTVDMIDVAPGVIYNNTYTSSQEGLRAYIHDKTRNGAWISLRQLGGNGWSADADADDSVVSASTYKLFLAKRLFDEINNGRTSWSDPMLNTTVSGCFDRMTIASTNPCAERWLDVFGRQSMNNYVYGLGFSRAVTFTNSRATHVSAGDLTKFMVGLERGTLIGGAHRERLLYSLSHHPYRKGIPAGSKARQVYNKVGFLWDYVHDTAIVRHPKGTYILTIMTKGKSYYAIAGVTREIEKIMYPE